MCLSKGGVCVLVGLVVLVRGLRPAPPLLVGGGGAPVGVWSVLREDAGLCVVETWGLSPRTPVVTGRGCPPVLRGRGGGLLFGRGGVSLGFVDKQHGARREQAGTIPTLPTSFLFLSSLPAHKHP